MSSLGGIVAALHELAALRPGHEFWRIDKGDEKELNQKIGDVLRWYSIKATQKAIDHFALALFMWRLDTPRFVLEVQQRRREAAGQGQGSAPSPAGSMTGPVSGATIFRFTPPQATTPVEVETPGLG